MGVINAANNITLYAISAQVIGPMLDAGGCRNKNMGPAVHTGAYWTLDESCTVDPSHPGNTINQKDDLICIRGDGIGNITQSCTLTHTVKVGEGEVERPDDCHATWVGLFLNWGLAMFLGLVIFWVSTAGMVDLTTKIDEDYAKAKGQPVTAVANGRANGVEPSVAPPASSDVTPL